MLCRGWLFLALSLETKETTLQWFLGMIYLRLFYTSGAHFNDLAWGPHKSQIMVLQGSRAPASLKSKTWKKEMQMWEIK